MRSCDSFSRETDAPNGRHAGTIEIGPVTQAQLKSGQSDWSRRSTWPAALIVSSPCGGKPAQAPACWASRTTSTAQSWCCPCRRASQARATLPQRPSSQRRLQALLCSARQQPLAISRRSRVNSRKVNRISVQFTSPASPRWRTWPPAKRSGRLCCLLRQVMSSLLWLLHLSLGLHDADAVLCIHARRTRRRSADRGADVCLRVRCNGSPRHDWRQHAAGTA